MASIQRIVSPLTQAVSYRAQVRVKGRPAQSVRCRGRDGSSRTCAADCFCWPRETLPGNVMADRFPLAHPVRTLLA
jgi:hypothetical protein